MKCVQTKLMNYYSPVPPSYPRHFQFPFDCCICPSQPPSSCTLNALCCFFINQYLQPSKCHWYESMTSWPRYLPDPRQFSKEDTKVERVGLGQRRLGRRRSPRSRMVLRRRRPKVTAIHHFEGGWGMLTINSCGNVCCHAFNQLLMVGAVQGEAKGRRNQSFSPRWDDVWRRPYRQKKDVPQKNPKPFYD